MVSSRRSCLSVPGSSERMLAKAATLPADEVIVDLEDSVVPERKEEARALAVSAVRSWSAGPALAVRINPLSTAWGRADAEALAGAGSALGSLVVPKVESADELAEVDGVLGVGSSLGLQALIETASGLARVGEITDPSSRLETLITGYADLAASLGRPP